jgi:hypothetical protein
MRSVIRNVVIHLSNEQPLLGDLYAVPGPSDAGLLCTNVRMMNGKRPVFIDAAGSTFFFPYHIVRFLEMPPAELAKHQAAGGNGLAFGEGTTDAASTGDEERLPVVVGGRDDGAGAEDLDDLEIDLDIDEDFLQRVRDI